jgi:bacillithiol synthase
VAKPAGIEILVGHPEGGAVVRAHLSGDPEASPFLGDRHDRLASFEAKAKEVDARFDREARERAASALIAPEGADAARIERFIEDGGYVVTTGQQPGLFGGPLYSVHKALTAVRLAETLEARLGRPVLPVFWVASDDHDWAEANHADLVGVDNELHHIELEATDPARTPPLHRIPLGAGVESCIEELVRCLPETDFSPDLIALIRASFTADATMPDAYRDTLRHLLGRFGLFFTDAAHPKVKEVSAGTLLAELDRAAEMERVLRGTAEKLEAAGYSLQVPILEGGVNLFLEGPHGRERLYVEDGSFRLRASGTVVDAADVRAAVREDPTVLSPNVLLRPVVESVVFPTLAYVGGPGEMAYFAQLADYFEAHGVRMPVVFPRWAATPVEVKVRKVLDKFGLDPDALRRPFHEIAQDIARDEVPDEIRAALGRLKGAIAQGVAEVQSAAVALDPTLKGSVQTMRGQSFAAMEDLERKILQAVKRESEIALAQLEKARVHLFPHGKPAERVHNPFYYLSRYGDAFLDALYERFEVTLD